VVQAPFTGRGQLSQAAYIIEEELSSMTEAKVEKEEQGQPLLSEEFVETLHPVLQWIVNNAKMLAIGVVVVLGLMAAYGLYENMQAKTAADKANALGQIVMQKPSKEKVAALEAFAKDAPAVLQTAVLFEMAQAMQEAKEYKRASEIWEQIAAKGDKSVAPVAAFGRAQTLAMAGEPAKGLAVLEEYKSAAPKPYSNILLQRIAQLAEQSGDKTKAVAAYKELLDKEKTQVQARSYYEHKIASLSDAKGK
jgi:predicted negative regulator of RcsB-dependent stress response